MSAQDAAERVLGAARGASFARVWTSPSERCQAPASLVAQRLAVPLAVDGRLREISLGEWQLRSWASIEASDAARYQSWLQNWLTQAPPGGERPDELLARVRAWFDDLPAGRHLLVAHAGVTRALRVLVNGSSWEAAMTAGVAHLEGEWFGLLA